MLINAGMYGHHGNSVSISVVFSVQYDESFQVVNCWLRILYHQLRGVLFSIIYIRGNYLKWSVLWQILILRNCMASNKVPCHSKPLFHMVFHILLVRLVFDQVLSKPFYKWYDLLHMKWIWASLFDDYSTESSHGMINQCSTFRNMILDFLSKLYVRNFS